MMKRSQSHLIVVIIILISLVFTIAESVSAQDVTTVNTSSGEISNDGFCSLPEAIINVNNDANTNPDCGHALSIVLTDNVILTDVLDNTDGANGLPSITGEVIIDGNDMLIQRQSNTPPFRIFHIAGGGSLTLNNVTIENGFADGSSPDSLGGGILSFGTLNLDHTTISQNTAEFGGGIFNGGTLTITDTTISQNTANISGGGLSNDGSTVTMISSTVSDNFANGGVGGGIHNSGNARFGAMSITNSTISQNTADTLGGGIYDGAAGSISLTSSTIADNEAGSRGGGIYNASGATQTMTITNTLIARSRNGNCFTEIGSHFITNGTNYSTDEMCSGFTFFTANQLQLTALGDYGGPTQTHQLLPNSLAINAVAVGDCTVTTDQRGIIRPNTAANRCDVGAFEADLSAPQAAPNYTVNTTDTSDDTLCTVSHCTLIEAINAANGDNQASTVTLQNGATYTLEKTNNSTDGDNALPLITSQIGIVGNNATIERDTLAQDLRIFYVATAGSLVLNNVTVRNGRMSGNNGGGILNQGELTLENSTVSNNTTGLSGGGIYSTGRLSLTATTVSNNGADAGAGIANDGTAELFDSTVSINSASTFGGGILNDGASATLTLNDSSVSNNTAVGSGGGIFNNSGTAILLRSTVSENTAQGFGGGINNLVGTMELTDSTVFKNATVDNGGGIYNAGTLTLTNTTVLENTARNEDGDDGEGGGIYNANASNSITMTNSTISANIASSGGGISSSGVLTISDSTILKNEAIFSFGGGISIVNHGSMTMTNSSVTGNDAHTEGGGIYSQSFFGTVAISGSTVSNNEANRGAGGGIRADTGRLEIGDTTFSGNIAKEHGGALKSDFTRIIIARTTFSGNTSTDENGGAIDICGQTVTITESLFNGNTAQRGGGLVSACEATVDITNSTFSGNTGILGGGAIRIQDDSASNQVRLNFVTIAGNTSNSGGLNVSNNGTIRIKNSIVANNSGGNCVAPGPGSIQSAGGNFASGDSTCNGFTVVTTTALALGALTDNGGPTRTIALSVGSPAINGAFDCKLLDGTTTVATDQRGLTRPRGSACDAGAFEVQVVTPPSTTANVAPLSNGIAVWIGASPAQNCISGLAGTAVLNCLYAPGALVTLTVNVPSDTYYSLNSHPVNCTAGQHYTDPITVDVNGINTLYFCSVDTTGIQEVWQSITLKIDATPVEFQHIEVSQVVQNESNSVRLIAGKDTFVRVYLQCKLNLGATNYPCPANQPASGTISILPGGTPAVALNALTPQQNVSDWRTLRNGDPNTAAANTTLNFKLDLAWTNAGSRTFTVTVWGVAGATSSASLSPTPCCAFVAANPIEIIYVPINYTYNGANDTATNVNTVNFLEAQWFPTDNIIYHLPAAGVVPYLWSGDMREEVNNQPNPIGVSNQRVTLPMNLDVAYNGPFTDTNRRHNFIVGWMPNGYTVKTTGWAGYSQTTICDRNTGRCRTTITGSAAWIQADGNRWRWFAHEVAHLTGAQHTNTAVSALCPIEDRTSDNTWWPHQGNPQIGDYGLWWDGTTLRVVPPTANDYMSYCIEDSATPSRDVWTSETTYNEVFPGEHVSGAMPLSARTNPTIYLVSGLIFQDDTVLVDPIWTLGGHGYNPNPPPGSAYCVEARDGAGAALDSVCFDLEFTDGESNEATDVSAFNIALPVAANAQAVVLRKGADVLFEWRASEHEPSVSILTPNGGEFWNTADESSDMVTVSWVGSDADGDTLFYRPYYSHNGIDWTPLSPMTTETSVTFDMSNLAGGSTSLVRVFVTDGIHTLIDNSDATFTVATHAPQASIVEPASSISVPVGSSVWLRGYGYDLEDGVLDDARFQWSSDLQGFLGTGEVIMPELHLGLHTITLTVTDSDSNQATDSIQINVSPASTDTIPPTTTIAVSGEPGNNGWYVSDVTATLTAQDNEGGSGVAFTDWQLDTVGDWQPYTTPIIHTQEGQAAIFAASTDMAGNRESPPVEANVSLDKTPPTIEISPGQGQYTRVDVLALNITAFDSMPGSGLFEVRTVFDGETLENTQEFDMFWLPLGTHNFLAQAEDYAGWVSQAEGSFELIATIDSLMPTLTRMCDEGYVRNRSLCNSFGAQVRAAQASVQRGNIHTAINQLNALLNHLNAQNGRGLATSAFNILDQDVRYVIRSLSDDSLTDTSQSDDPVGVAVATTPEPSATPETSLTTLTEIVTPVDETSVVTSEVPDTEVLPTATPEVTEESDTEVLPTDTPEGTEESDTEVLPTEVIDTNILTSVTPEPTDESNDVVLPSATPEATETVDETTPVTPLTINIEFAGTGNTAHINCQNPNFAVSVAILTTDTFDATTVNPDTVRFEGAVEEDSSPQNRHERDVDRDGDTDLLFRFRLRNTTLTCTSRVGVLTGQTFDGIALRGVIVLTMTAENVRPVALNDEARLTTGSIVINVLANDVDANGDSLRVVEIASPLNGANQLNSDGTITYTAQVGFVGVDTFTYTITDGMEMGYAVVTIYVGE